MIPRLINFLGALVFSYGDVGRGNIPPNAWLNFDIELLKVKSGRKKARKVKKSRRAAAETSSTAR
jgi:hypothetical protein